MIYQAKDLLPEQKAAIESLVGRPVSDDEAVSIQTLRPGTAPQWLEKSWASAKQHGVDQLSAEDIDAEIRSSRKSRISDQIRN